MSGQNLRPKTVAERLGISTRWLAELSKRGVLPKTGQDKTARHPWPEVRHAYDEHLRQQGALEATVADLQAERAQLVRVQRERAGREQAPHRQPLVTGVGPRGGRDRRWWAGGRKGKRRRLTFPK